MDREQGRNVIDRHPGEADRLHRELVDWLREHEAHPKLVEGFRDGVPVAGFDVCPRPDFLKNFQPYWHFMLSDGT